MIDDGLVSIIIPAFNAGGYIGRCLENICSQTYRNLEIIVIDDGSTDETKNICYLYRKRDERIRVFSQNNKGVSIARNYGINVARGKWLLFLDADDMMDCNAIEQAIEFAVLYSSDTVCWNCVGIVNNSEKQLFPHFIPSNEFILDENHRNTILKALYYSFDMDKFYPGRMFRAVWGKILSKKIIDDNSITFPEGVPLGEDAAFLSKYFSFASRIVFIDKAWNLYNISIDSAVGKYRENVFELQQEELKRFVLPLDLDEVDKNTVLLNYYMECDRQYITNIRKKNRNIVSVFLKMYKYLYHRDASIGNIIQWNEIQKKKSILAYAILHKLKFAEAFIDMFF